MAAALNYHEPDIVSILTLGAFLLLLSISNYVFDRLLSCGLVAQILVGIAWSTPGAKLLDEGSESLITSLGYIGLILLVFEGGLETSIISLRKNLGLACLVATTGIVFPIGLSFTLMPMIGASPLQSFAAGAALCSTSLGTTFTILRSSGLVDTRLGSILTSAAMLDDVVGLIMVQVISNLRGTFQVASILRPLGVSFAFILLSTVACLSLRYCTEPFLKSFLGSRLSSQKHFPFLAQTAFLLAMVTGASYAGTSNLFAAYLAGVCLSWWYGHFHGTKEAEKIGIAQSSGYITSDVAGTGEEPTNLTAINTQNNGKSSVAMYRNYYGRVTDAILKPFFFASIGFAIPISQMFQGSILWRGLIYTLLMCIAKMITGLWLSKLNIWYRLCRLTVGFLSLFQHHARQGPHPQAQNEAASQYRPGTNQPAKGTIELLSGRTATQSTKTVARPLNPSISQNMKSQSFYPATILGMAMVARGEIGFLIAATAQSSAIFDQNGSQMLYLIVIWAVTLCTVIGPVTMGILVRRLRGFEKTRLGSYGTA